LRVPSGVFSPGDDFAEMWNNPTNLTNRRLDNQDRRRKRTA
jgi:hypothetical protein